MSSLGPLVLLTTQYSPCVTAAWSGCLHASSRGSHVPGTSHGGQGPGWQGRGQGWGQPPPTLPHGAPQENTWVPQRRVVATLPQWQVQGTAWGHRGHDPEWHLRAGNKGVSKSPHQCRGRGDDPVTLWGHATRGRCCRTSSTIDWSPRAVRWERRWPQSHPPPSPTLTQTQAHTHTHKTTTTTTTTVPRRPCLYEPHHKPGSHAPTGSPNALGPQGDRDRKPPRNWLVHTWAHVGRVRPQLPPQVWGASHASGSGLARLGRKGGALVREGCAYDPTPREPSRPPHT
jgi:hypothetical protein